MNTIKAEEIELRAEQSIPKKAQQNTVVSKIERIKYIAIAIASFILLIYIILLAIRNESSDKYQKIDSIITLLYKLTASANGLQLRSLEFDEAQNVSIAKGI